MSTEVSGDLLRGPLFLWVEPHGPKDRTEAKIGGWGKISSTFNFSRGPAQPAQAGSHTLWWQVPEGLARLPPASAGRFLVE